MGTNVIYLDELPSSAAVPAYRRARLRALSPAPERGWGVPATPLAASWVAAAQRRAALRLASASAAQPLTPAPQPVHALPVQPVAQTTVQGAPVRTGALRLTGRLVDVCAELERLAQAEALAESQMRRA